MLHRVIPQIHYLFILLFRFLFVEYRRSALFKISSKHFELNQINIQNILVYLQACVFFLRNLIIFCVHQQGRKQHNE